MDMEQAALTRLRTAARMSEKIHHKPLMVTTSGGKDSSVCVALAERAGIAFEIMHNHTTADAPETVRFVRDEFRRLEMKGIKCTVNQPMYKGAPTTMWKLIPLKSMPPTRVVRYCCDILKEQGGKGRFITTGVRWAESVKRESSRGIYEAISKSKEKSIILSNDNDDTRQLFESCSLKAKRACNPIVDWTDSDVWDYIRAEKIPVNPLYSCGFSRVGCIGCPMAGTRGRQAEFARYPKYRLMYLRAFERMLDERKRRGFPCGWETAEDVYHWWMEDGLIAGQLSFDDLPKTAEATPPIRVPEPTAAEDAA